MKIRIFVSRKFVKRTEKILFSLVFVCFRFTEISYFLNFPSNDNVYSCVNMKFSYTITVRKINFLCRFVTKTSDFSPAFRSTFPRRYLSERWNLLRRMTAETSHWSTFRWRCLYFVLIFCRKRDRRFEDLFFSPSWK